MVPGPSEDVDASVCVLAVQSGVKHYVKHYEWQKRAHNLLSVMPAVSPTYIDYRSHFFSVDSIWWPRHGAVSWCVASDWEAAGRPAAPLQSPVSRSLQCMILILCHSSRRLVETLSIYLLCMHPDSELWPAAVVWIILFERCRYSCNKTAAIAVGLGVW